MGYFFHNWIDKIKFSRRDWKKYKKIWKSVRFIKEDAPVPNLLEGVANPVFTLQVIFVENPKGFNPWSFNAKEKYSPKGQIGKRAREMVPLGGL